MSDSKRLMDVFFNPEVSKVKEGPYAVSLEKPCEETVNYTEVLAYQNISET